MTEISLSGRGARGESQADILRRTGQFGVLPTDTDAQAVGKLNADAAASAALAEAVSGPVYASTALGLAATASGEYFAVDAGSGLVSIYLDDAGVAVLQRTLATSAALAAPTGAALVGKAGGGTVQGHIDALTAPAGSALIGFTQASTATPDTVAAALQGTARPTDAPWNADPTGVVDSTAALNAWAAFCKTNGVFAQGVAGTYKVTGTVTINCNGDMSNMLLLANATTVSPVIQCGNLTGAGSAAQYFYTLVLPKVKNSAKIGTGWAGFTNSIGISFGNLYSCRLTIPYVWGFGVGVRAGGYTAGFVYNEINLGFMYNNMIGLDLYNQGTGGWCNQNNWYGGLFNCDTAEGTNVAGVYDIRLSSGLSSFGPPNENVFYNPSLEDDTAQFNLNLWGSFNTFINPRFEVSGGGRIQIYSLASNDTNSNLFIAGYVSTAPNFTFTGAASNYNQWIGTKSNDAHDYTSSGANVVNQTGSSLAYPHFQGFEAGTPALGKTAASTTWSYRIYANGFAGKQPGDTNPRARWDFSAGKLYFDNGTTASPTHYIGAFGPDNFAVNNNWQPWADNTWSIGTSSYRWSVIYSNTGAINTSDERDKVWRGTATDAEMAAAKDISADLGFYQWKDVVASKGDEARLHFGVRAQRVWAIMAKHGLVDPIADGKPGKTPYAFLCYDEWDAQAEVRDNHGAVTRPALAAGNRFGVRPDQLALFLLAAQEQRLRALETK